MQRSKRSRGSRLHRYHHVVRLAGRLHRYHRGLPPHDGRKLFRPQNIVIGHLNHLPVTHVFSQLADLIRNRGLRTVNLNDVFARPRV